MWILTQFNLVKNFSEMQRLEKPVHEYLSDLKPSYIIGICNMRIKIKISLPTQDLVMITQDH